MKKMYKKECRKYDEVRVIDTDTGAFTSYLIDKVNGFPFSHMNSTVIKMGYKSINDCMKSLKERNLLGAEVDFKAQRQAERIALINLGVMRIERAGRICTTDFEDICERLISYGVGFVDAQNQIIGAYLHKQEAV